MAERNDLYDVLARTAVLTNEKYRGVRLELSNGSADRFEDHTELLLKSINKKKFYLSSFGETAEGELLLVDYSGSIYRLSNR